MRLAQQQQRQAKSKRKALLPTTKICGFTFPVRRGVVIGIGIGGVSFVDYYYLQPLLTCGPRSHWRSLALCRTPVLVTLREEDSRQQNPRSHLAPHSFTHSTPLHSTPGSSINNNGCMLSSSMKLERAYQQQKLRLFWIYKKVGKQT